MSTSKKTGNGKAGPSKPDRKGKGKANKTSNIEMKANVRDSIGGIEIEIEGGWVAAVYLDEIRDRVLRDTNAQGAYDHPPARGSHALDVTAFHADHKSWGESRDQRPKILFEYKRNGREDPDYEVGTWMDNGRVVLGPDGLPIRNFRDIPLLCSSQMEGFRMEAISRLDSRITISDFRARMMRDGLQGANAMSMRKTRFRSKARCLAWDKRAGSDSHEVKLKAEMTPDMINRNSTEELEDLSSAKAEKLQLDTAGSAPARSGTRALPDNVRALRFKTAKERNSKKLQAEEKMQKKEGTEEKVEKPNTLSETTPVVGTKKRKRTTQSDLSDALHEFVDELFEEERPGKKQRRQQGPAANQDDLNANKRKRAEVSDNEDTDGDRAAKRSRFESVVDAPLDDVDTAEAGPSRPTRRRANSPLSVISVGGPAVEQGGASSSNSEEGLDERDIVPFTQRERARIQNALAPTRRHYEYITHGAAPDTESRENYLSQWASLQLSFNNVWRGVGLEDPIPLLAGLDMWTPGSVVWSQNTAQILDLEGADAWRLFEELQEDLRDGLGGGPNQRAPREVLAADWQILGGLNAANPGPPAAPAQFAGDQHLPAFDPLAPFGLFDPTIPLGPSSSFVQAPAYDPSAGINPSAVWQPIATWETQTSFTEAFPADQGPSTRAPAAGAPADGELDASSSSPAYWGYQGPDDEFQTWLDPALRESASATPQRAIADSDVEQPRHSAFEDSFFADAARLNDNSVADLPNTGAPESPMFGPQPLTAPETVNPEDLSFPGLAEDFEMWINDPNYWLS